MQCASAAVEPNLHTSLPKCLLYAYVQGIESAEQTQRIRRSFWDREIKTDAPPTYLKLVKENDVL